MLHCYCSAAGLDAAAICQTSGSLLETLSDIQDDETAVALAAAASDGGWAGDVRSGLYLILGSRTGQQQRHSALRLAAAVLEIVQSEWLLGPVSAVSLFAVQF